MNCKYCGRETVHLDVCGDCLKQLANCPLTKPLCSFRCPYKKEGLCDYPFIGRVRAYPDKLEAK